MARKTVLIVDDDQLLVRALTRRCRQLGLNVRTSFDGAEATYELTMVSDSPPDLIIMDVNLPLENGLNVWELLADDRILAPVPVIILTGRSDEESIRRCESLGAHYLLKSSDVWEHLRPIVSELLELPSDESQDTEPDAPLQSDQQSEGPSAPTVLCIDDDRDFCKAVKVRLGSSGIKVLTAFNGVQGYWRALKEKPDLIMADFNMPANGNYVLRSLKSHSLTQNIPVIIVTGRSDARLKRELLRQGATDFWTKPVDFSLLIDELNHHVALRPAYPSAAHLVPASTSREASTVQTG